MTRDTETLAVYAAEVRRYADFTAGETPPATLIRFLGSLPSGARILDLGCGPGHDAAAMVARGFAVDATDASPQMVAEAQRRGVAARIATFDEIAGEDAYDGIWASFSLLHAPKAEMAGHLARLRRALVPGGRLALGLKIGDGEARDRLGRFYAYYREAEIDGLLAQAGFTVTGRETGTDPGLDGIVADWMVVYADG